MRTHNIFVYGTLKNGMCNNHILQKLTRTNDARYMMDCETTKKYPMYKSNQYFPYLENQPGLGLIVQGELWEVSDKAMSKLDAFEGVPDLYKRGLIEVETENLTVTVEVYFKAENTAIENKNCIEEWTE